MDGGKGSIRANEATPPTGGAIVWLEHAAALKWMVMNHPPIAKADRKSSKYRVRFAIPATAMNGRTGSQCIAPPRRFCFTPHAGGSRSSYVSLFRVLVI